MLYRQGVRYVVLDTPPVPPSGYLPLDPYGQKDRVPGMVLMEKHDTR
jgi:hypothetical protein